METPIDAILNLLADGKPHSLNEISTLEPLSKITMENMMKLLNLLNEFDFIELDEVFRGYTENSTSGDFIEIVEAKSTPPLQTFLRNIKLIEREENAKHSDRF